MAEFATSLPEAQADSLPATAVGRADLLRQALYRFLLPLLDTQMDSRLVRTFHQAIETILVYRNRPHGLLLSELGGYLLSPDKAPAGTKRLSNLLRSSRFAASLIHDFLWQQARYYHKQLAQEGKSAYLLWDESVLEKPESKKAQGLCPVRSSKAKRLDRSRPGPPKPTTFVNGWHWLCLILVGPTGPPVLAAMRWFTTRGALAQDLRQVQAELLKRCRLTWGKAVVHLFDRGYASAAWIDVCLDENLRFIVRWPKRYHLLDKGEIEKPAWQVLRGQPSWGKCVVRDAVQNRSRTLGLLAALVSHPKQPDRALWLVCARPDDAKEPWLLLTTEPIRSLDEALSVVLAYARRWQIEMVFRFGKSELAMESPRLWTMERREKLLLLVSLGQAFFLSLLADAWEVIRLWLLRQFCHRTGKKNKEATAPLYRLRTAISRLFLAYPETDAPVISKRQEAWLRNYDKWANSG